MIYPPEQLDILSRAYYGVMDRISLAGRDAEAVKVALLRGLLEAAHLGEWDEDRLQARALRAVSLYKSGRLNAVMRSTPL
jgi:hypothetical protein